MGGVLALLAQTCGLTPFGALVREVFVMPVHTDKSIAATRIQSIAGSLPYLQNTACQDAACAAR